MRMIRVAGASSSSKHLISTGSSSHKLPTNALNTHTASQCKVRAAEQDICLFHPARSAVRHPKLTCQHSARTRVRNLHLRVSKFLIFVFCCPRLPNARGKKIMGMCHKVLHSDKYFLEKSIFFNLMDLVFIAKIEILWNDTVTFFHCFVQ